MNESILLTFATYMLRAFIPLFFGVFLLFYRKRSKQNLPLSCIFIIIGLLYLYNSFVRLPNLASVDVYNVRSFLILIFIAPFTIFYANYAVNKKTSYKTKLLHFIPFVTMFGLWFLLRDTVQPSIPPCYDINEVLGYFSEYPLHVIYFLLLMVVFEIQVCVYFSTALIRFLKVRKIHRENGMFMGHTNRLLVMDALFWYYPSLCIIFMSYNNSIIMSVIHNISVAVVVTAIGSMSLSLRLPLKIAFLPKNDDFLQLKKDLPENEISVIDSRLLKQIQKLFDEKQVYKNPALTLEDVVKKCFSNRTYVSNCINRHYGCTFKQFLTRYRILEALKLLANTDSSIQQIITDVGFNSRSTFYKAFEEHAGKDISPLEWREQVLRKS